MGNNLKGLVVQRGQAIVLTEISDYFDQMANACRKDKGIPLTLEQSYLSKYDVADQLRVLVKDKTVKPPVEIRPLLDANKAMIDIVREGNYSKLEDYLNNLSDADFEPPLKQTYQSVEGETIYPTPGRISKDPRRTGYYVRIGPVDVVKSEDMQRWFINNSLLYGFVLYGDDAFYYLGVQAIKDSLKKAKTPAQELKKIIGRFTKIPNVDKLITTTAQAVTENKLPPAPSVPPQTNLPGGGNVEKALRYLIEQKNYPRWKAAGVVAAIMGEAGPNLSPTIENSTSGAFGIAQWLGVRLQNLKKIAGAGYNTLAGQLDYLSQELSSSGTYVDTISRPYIQQAGSDKEVLAAMATFERWEYPVKLFKESGGKGYGAVYAIMKQEALNGQSPDKSFRQRIGYLGDVNRLLDKIYPGVPA